MRPSRHYCGYSSPVNPNKQRKPDGGNPTAAISHQKDGETKISTGPPTGLWNAVRTGVSKGPGLSVPSTRGSLLGLFARGLD